MKFEELINKYIYVFVRTGAIHEIETEGKDVNKIIESLNEKGFLFIQEINSGVNSVDISSILSVIEYIKWINTKRPKTFFRNGVVKNLALNEIYGEKILKAHEEKKKLLSLEKKKYLPHKD